MSGQSVVPTPEELRERVARINGKAVREGTYRAQQNGDSLTCTLPPPFTKQFSIEQSSELETFRFPDLGCVLIFPKELIDNEPQ